MPFPRRRKKKTQLMSVLASVVTVLGMNLVALSAGHSFLMEPRPYGPGCEGCDECPLVVRWRSKDNTSEWWHTTTWARNQSVQVRWQKNNHNGGFVRLSLVPLEYMYDASALSRFAFYYTCWERGEYPCEGTRLCGSDMGQRAFHKVVTVPSVVPDGEYVLAFLWFGGLHWRRLRGRFADYTSCARVTIRGGAPLATSQRPIFEPGPDNISDHNEVCLTSSIKPGQCTDGCPDTLAFYSKPFPFRDGSTVPLLVPPNITSLNDNHHGPTGILTNLGNDATPGDTHNGGKSPDNDPGRCRNGVCCATSCGICIQPGCRYRKGGYLNCCPMHIRRAGRQCRHKGAPCLVVGGVRKYF